MQSNRLRFRLTPGCLGFDIGTTPFGALRITKVGSPADGAQSTEDVARKCRCGKAMVIRRLQFIERPQRDRGTKSEEEVRVRCRAQLALTISTEISTAGVVPRFSSQCVVFLSSGQPTPGPYSLATPFRWSVIVPCSM